MQSLTKQPITPADIQAAVDDCFGGPLRLGAVTELNGGWYNAAYAVSLPDLGIETVLRVSPHPSTRLLSYEKDLMQREVHTYTLLAQRGGIPVPQVYGWNFRRDRLPRDYMFIERMSGSPLDQVKDSLSPAELDVLYRELGAVARRIHSIQGESFGYSSGFPGGTPFPANQTWRTAFLHMVDTLLKDGEALQVELPAPYDDVRRVYYERASLLDEITTPYLVHWDLWDPNVFVVQRDSSWHIEAVTDCDRSFWGDPQAEYILIGKEPDHPLFQGYGPMDGSTESGIRRRLYFMYLLLVMNIEAVTRFASAGHVSWAYQQLKNALEQ